MKIIIVLLVILLCFIIYVITNRKKHLKNKDKIMNELECRIYLETWKIGYRVTAVLDDGDKFICCMYDINILNNNDTDKGFYIAPYYQVDKKTGVIKEYSTVENPKHFRYLLDNKMAYKYYI